MKTLAKVGAALLLALVLSMTPAFALGPVSDHSPYPVMQSQSFTPPMPINGKHQPFIRYVIGALSLALLVGTVTNTYATPAFPGAPTLGGTTPPTVAQAKNINTLATTVNCADTDVSIAIVHNWGLSAAQIAAQLPVLTLNVVTAGTATAAFSLGTNPSAANTFTITKASAAGSGGTFLAILQLPYASW